jgi:hypothetical protein
MQQITLPMLAVYDKKTGHFEPPFVCRHLGDAIREWDIVRKNTDTKFGKNPEDFDLFQIANYNDALGEIETLKPHTHLATGV